MNIFQESSAMLKVMVIEDNKPMQLVLNHHLNTKFDVTIFPDGFEAMAYLHEGNVVDIIISDLNTPRMNGYELLDQLRASSFFNSIPIIVLSGEESTDTRIKCLEAGADDYLVKPFKPPRIDGKDKCYIEKDRQNFINLSKLWTVPLKKILASSLC